MNDIENYLGTDASNAILGLLHRHGIKLTYLKHEYIMYTLNHKEAIILTYLALCIRQGYTVDYTCLNRLIYHDTDKVFMYTVIDKKDTSSKHRQYATHHVENYKNGNIHYNLLEAMLDYECARFTKEDKPENAYETAIRKDAYGLFKESLDKFGIDSSERISIDFKEASEVYNKYIKSDYINKNISVLSRMIQFYEFNTVAEIVNNFHIRLNHGGL